MLGKNPDLYGQTSEIMPDPFVNMIKPVGSQCNLTCFYCYYLGTDKSLEQEPTGRMPDDLLEKAIVQTIKASPGPVVSFVWHGGEPTLAGLDFYRMAVSIQKANLPSGWSCWNSLQTNGVLLDDAWCDFWLSPVFRSASVWTGRRKYMMPSAAIGRERVLINGLSRPFGGCRNEVSNRTFYAP